MPVVNYLTIDGEIVYENRAGVERDYLRDPSGNVVALLDGTQTKTDTFEYWPFGEVRSRTGTTPTPFQYLGVLGYYADVATGLQYVRSRYLQPSTGRWLTVDPLWFRSDTLDHPYTYARNSPAVFTDPTGLATSPITLKCGNITISDPGAGSPPNPACDTVTSKVYPAPSSALYQCCCKCCVLEFTPGRWSSQLGKCIRSCAILAPVGEPECRPFR